MKAEEIREMSLEEMKQKAIDLKEGHFNLRFQHGTGQLENSSTLNKSRKDIARLMTIIRENELKTN